jgi:uncharacterized membrane protein
MTETAHAPTDPLSKRRRTRRLMFGCIAAAVVSFIAVDALGFPVLAVALYWGGFLAFLGVWKFSDVQVYDERDAAIERRASMTTMGIAAIALIFGGPGLSVLDETGVYDSPALLDGAMFGLMCLFGVFAGAYVYHRYRR